MLSNLYKQLFIVFLSSFVCVNAGYAQGYTTVFDTFYVSTPEYNSTLGIDSLLFPCAITTPDTGANFPVLILVHGTSALDMNTNSTKDYLDSVGAVYRKAETAMFYEIADSLSRNGIMVLRYDKRSYTVNCIENPACWYVDTISPYDYIKDIHSAVDFVKGVPLVDTCNIFLAGHSQGGSFVSKVGYDRSDIRGVLNMAGTAQPIDSVSIYQEEFINSNPLGAVTLREQFDSLRTGLWPMTDTLFNAHFSPRFWLDWLSHTDSAVIVQQNSDKSTALMYGTADRFVPANIHYQIWQNEITRPNVSFELFTDIDHSFGSEYDSVMSPQVLSFMTDWIHATKLNCGLSGLSELSQNARLSIYPNPGTDMVYVNSTMEGNTDFQLVNVMGETLLSGELMKDEPFPLNISILPKGVYMIQSETTVIKFVKQ